MKIFICTCKIVIWLAAVLAVILSYCQLRVTNHQLSLQLTELQKLNEKADVTIEFYSPPQTVNFISGWSEFMELNVLAFNNGLRATDDWIVTILPNLNLIKLATTSAEIKSIQLGSCQEWYIKSSKHLLGLDASIIRHFGVDDNPDSIADLKFTISTTTLNNQKNLIAEVSVAGENAELTSEKIYLQITPDGLSFSFEKRPKNVSVAEFFNNFNCGEKK